MKDYDNPDFPVKIDLGKTPSETDIPVVADGDKKKPKKYYPTLYLSNIPGLEALPKDGVAMIYFHRSDLSLRTPDGGDDGASAELQIKEICLPEDSGDDGEDIGSAIAKALKNKGVDAGQDDYSEEDDE